MDYRYANAKHLGEALKIKADELGLGEVAVGKLMGASHATVSKWYRGLQRIERPEHNQALWGLLRVDRATRNDLILRNYAYWAEIDLNDPKMFPEV